MNKSEAKRVFAIADNPANDLSGVDISMFDGYGLPDFQPVDATVNQVAALMRWQCMNIGHPIGRPDLKWDMEAVNDFNATMRRKVRILN